MFKPTVHINGTSLSELMDQNQKAYLAVCDAVEALIAAAPHGRDYYPQDTPGVGYIGLAYQEARKEHQARLDRLDSVKQDLNEIAEYLSDMHDQREAQKRNR